MNFRLIAREPDKAYVSDMLWLPKRLIPQQAIKEGLQYWDVDGKQAVMRKLWEETEHHIICPREYIKPSQYSLYQFPFIDLTPKQFPFADIQVIHEPRNEDQRRAFEALLKSEGGILNLGCGHGKTFLALKLAATLKCPLLVIVHNSYLFNQWINEAIPDHVILPEGETVGVIQGPIFDWEHPITIAMVHTLAARIDEGKIPSEFRKHYGLIIYDECQHLSAPMFVKTAPIITGRRYGLTATDKRSDGFDFIYKYHVGDVFYSDLKQKLIPRIYFQLTPIWVDLHREEVRDKNGELNIGRLRSFIGGLGESNMFRARYIKEAISQGRKLLCVSHSKEQLIKLHELFPGSGLIIQETPAEERSIIVKNSRVAFAIASLGFEGLDDENLDTVFILLPFKQPNDLQQVMGRIQRQVDDKKTPVVIIFEDVRIGPFRAMCKVMKESLKNWDKHVPGMPALDFTNLSVLST